MFIQNATIPIAIKSFSLVIHGFPMFSGQQIIKTANTKTANNGGHLYLFCLDGPYLVDAVNEQNDVWRTISRANQIIDFTNFPSFNQSSCSPGSYLGWYPYPSQYPSQYGKLQCHSRSQFFNGICLTTANAGLLLIKIQITKFNDLSLGMNCGSLLR